MKVVFDENFFDEIDHFHPNFDESVPDLGVGVWGGCLGWVGVWGWVFGGGCLGVGVWGWVFGGGCLGVGVWVGKKSCGEKVEER